jgi:hypothetical protein
MYGRKLAFSFLRCILHQEDRGAEDEEKERNEMTGWILNCKAFSALVSARLDRKLSFWEKLSMKLHRIMCPGCDHIYTQLETLRKACRCISDGDTDVKDQCRLPEDARLRIKAELKKHCV